MAKEGRSFASILEEWQRLSDQLDNDPENCPQEIANEYFRMANAVAKQFQKGLQLRPRTETLTRPPQRCTNARVRLVLAVEVLKNP